MTWASAFNEKQLGFRTTYSNARQISHHSYQIKTTRFQNTPSVGDNDGNSVQGNKCEFGERVIFVRSVVGQRQDAFFSTEDNNFDIYINHRAKLVRKHTHTTHKLVLLV